MKAPRVLAQRVDVLEGVDLPCRGPPAGPQEPEGGPVPRPATGSGGLMDAMTRNSPPAAALNSCRVWMRPEVQRPPWRRAVISRFPLPSRWTFSSESVMVSISPVPKMPWPVSYFQFAALGAWPATPEKESCQTVCHVAPVSGTAVDPGGYVMPVTARTIHSSAASVFHRRGHSRLGLPGADLPGCTTFLVSGISSLPAGIPGEPPDRFQGATVPGDPGQTRQNRSGRGAKRRR